MKLEHQKINLQWKATINVKAAIECKRCKEDGYRSIGMNNTRSFDVFKN